MAETKKAVKIEENEFFRFGVLEGIILSAIRVLTNEKIPDLIKVEIIHDLMQFHKENGGENE